MSANKAKAAQERMICSNWVPVCDDGLFDRAMYLRVARLSNVCCIAKQCGGVGELLWRGIRCTQYLQM
jgi:hypothetical protein